MTRVRDPKSTLAHLRRLLLAAAGGVALATGFAWSQNAPGLRGAVQDGAADPAAQQQAPTAYVPSSPGAVPDEEPADVPTADDGRPTSLYGEVAEDSATDVGAFGDSPVERSTLRLRSRQPDEKLDDETPARRPAVPATAAAKDTPPADETTTGATRVEAQKRAETVSADDPFGRVEPIEGRDITPEENPYEPLGLRLGTIILRPSLEQGLTATSNADLSPDARSAILSETTLRLNAVSDWTRHSASLDAYGTFSRSLSDYDFDETRAGVEGVFNYEISEELRARATVGYELRPETASSPVVIEDTVSDPWRQTFSGSLGLEKDVGKARFAVTGRLEQEDYGDADLQDGTVLSQADRNSTLATLVLRGGYEVSPALTPFVETEIGHRAYQEDVDASGFRRASDRYGLRGGVEMDLNEKLVGEISGGYIREDFDDDRLAPIAGPTLNAELTWSPERETSVALTAATTVEGSTTAGDSGSILHAGRIAVSREIRSNLTGNAALGLNYRDYSGSNAHDVLFNAEVGATWWLNRYAGLTGRLRHENQKSSIEGRDYDANSVFLGLKVQR